MLADISGNIVLWHRITSRCRKSTRSDVLHLCLVFSYVNNTHTYVPSKTKLSRNLILCVSFSCYPSAIVIISVPYSLILQYTALYYSVLQFYFLVDSLSWHLLCFLAPPSLFHLDGSRIVPKSKHIFSFHNQRAFAWMRLSCILVFPSFWTLMLYFVQQNVQSRVQLRSERDFQDR